MYQQQAHLAQVDRAGDFYSQGGAFESSNGRLLNWLERMIDDIGYPLFLMPFLCNEKYLSTKPFLICAIISTGTSRLQTYI